MAWAAPRPVLITVAVALLGYGVQAPWLVPSVGAPALIQLLLPDKPAGQAYGTGALA